MSLRARSRLVRPLGKGQITLPIAFRRELGIDDGTILEVALKDDKIEISPWRPAAATEPLRQYSSAAIKRFLREDRLDARTAAKVRRLLGKKPAR